MRGGGRERERGSPSLEVPPVLKLEDDLQLFRREGCEGRGKEEA